MRNFLPFLISLLLVAVAEAAPPTVPSSSLLYSAIEGNRFNLRFTSGNGSNRIVVMRLNQPVTGFPENGVEYTASLNFGAANTQFGSEEQYVVYRGAGSSFTITNLLPSSNYHIAIFEYNGTGVNTEYLLTPATGQNSTAFPPATPATNLNFSNIAGSSVRITYTSGSGAGRIVVGKKGSAVDVIPPNLSLHSPNSEFGEGTDLGGGNFALVNTAGTSVNISNLEPNTTYHFAVFERTGSSYPVYTSTAARGSMTTTSGPTTPTSSLSFSSIEGDRITISVSRGNGSRRLIIGKQGSAVTSVPVNGQVYTANGDWGLGQELAPGEFVVDNRSDNAGAIIKGLDINTSYHFVCYEFDQDAEGNTYYLQQPRHGSTTTAAAPNPATAINFTNVTGNSLTLTSAGGSGNYRMVLVKEGSAITDFPENLKRYTGSTTYGNGTDLGNGTFVLSGGTNTRTFNVSSLVAGRTYYFAVIEFSGNNYPVYGQAFHESITLPNEPGTAAKNFGSSILQGNSFNIGWTNGSGSRRIVIGRKSSAVSALPVDGTVYTASPNFGSGSEIEPGQFVVYNGTGSQIMVSSLEIGTTYHFAVFEYNQDGSTPDYLISSFLAGSATTYFAPTQQASASVVTITDNTASFSLTAGNGTGQFFVMKEAAPVDVDPSNLTNYSYSTKFGTTHLDNGNYIVYKNISSSNNFTVTNLKPGTTYYLSSYEYNGSTAPVFLTPGHSINFTTSGTQPTAAPTLASTSPVISQQEGMSLRVAWTNGNGDSRIVVARIGEAISFVPTAGTTYTANAQFGLGQEVSPGEFVVYNGAGSNVNVTALQKNQTIHFAVFEFNGTGANSNYLTATYLDAVGNTASAPGAGTTAAQFSHTDGVSKLSWTNGDGSRRMVVLKAGSPVLATPDDYTVYPANPAMGAGSQIGLNEFVVYSGTGNEVTITGLDENATYHYRVIEYNGQASPVYSSSYLNGSFSIGEILPVVWVSFNAERKATRVLLQWSTGMEENNAYFEIERKAGSDSWFAIARINGAGNSSTTTHYSYSDTQAGETAYSYRIKQVDQDGQFTYSSVQHVAARKSVASVLAYPNPAREQVWLRGLAPGQDAEVTLFDVTGAVKGKFIVGMDKPIAVAHLPAGQYWLQIIQKEHISTIGFIKR